MSHQTDAKIVHLLPPGSLTSDTRFVLVNAVYFKAGWDSPFQPERTSPGAFHKLDGLTSLVDQMSQTEELAYGSTDAFEAVQLPYSGNETAMVVLVPREGSSRRDRPITGDMLQSTFASPSVPLYERSLSLPKFTIKGGTISIRDGARALSE